MKVFNRISVFRSWAYFRDSPKLCCQQDKTESFSAKVTTDPPAPSLWDKLWPLTFARIMNRNASLGADLLIWSCFIPSAETPRSRALCQLYARFPYEGNLDWIIYLDFSTQRSTSSASPCFIHILYITFSHTYFSVETRESTNSEHKKSQFEVLVRIRVLGSSELKNVFIFEFSVCSAAVKTS